MKRTSNAAVIAVLLLSSACSSGGGGTSAAETTPPPTTTTPPAIASGVQTAIPDGVYRTRPRTEKDLVALGLTKSQIEFAKTENELWTKTIVYELRIEGNQFLLSAARDGGDAGVEDQGTFVVHGQTLDMTYIDGEPEYRMRFSISDGELRLTLLEALCEKTDPEHCSDFLVRAAYEALPFEAVS
jgi:hypothetical protein